MYQKMYRFLKTADKKWVSAILSLEANRPEQKRRGMCEKGNLYFAEQRYVDGNRTCIWEYACGGAGNAVYPK